jgi:hypothetical protein
MQLLSQQRRSHLGTTSLQYFASTGASCERKTSRILLDFTRDRRRWTSECYCSRALASLVSYSATVRGLNGGGFRLVACADHVNVPALLSTSAQFSWIWKALHTHRPYVEERRRCGCRTKRFSSSADANVWFMGTSNCASSKNSRSWSCRTE